MKKFIGLVAVLALPIGACSQEATDENGKSNLEGEKESSLSQSLAVAQNALPTKMGRDLALLHAQAGIWEVFPANGTDPFRIARREGDMAHVVRLDFPSGYTSNILSLNCEPFPVFKGIDTRTTKNDASPVREGMDADLSDYSLVEVSRHLCANEAGLRTETGTPARVIEILRSEILSAKPPEGY